MVDVELLVLGYVLELVSVNVLGVTIPVKDVEGIVRDNVKVHATLDVEIVVMEVVEQAVQDVMVVAEVVVETHVSLHVPNSVKMGVEYRVKGDVMESVLVAA